METEEAVAVDHGRAETYRAAARAAAAELAELEDAALALEARLAAVRGRARAVSALLDALRAVVPDAVPPRERWTPPDVAEPPRDLPRRLRRQAERVREEQARAASRPVLGAWEGLPGVVPEAVPGVVPEAVPAAAAARVDEVPGEPLDEVRVGVVPDVFAQPRADVQAWG